MGEYYVEGGVYADLSFETIEPGSEERHGPYYDYAVAYAKWMEIARFRVDNACHRVTVIDASPPKRSVLDADYNPLSIMEDYFIARAGS